MPGAQPRPRTPYEQEIAAEMRDLLADHMHVRHYARGELLWRQGDTAGLLVALRTGRVKMYRSLPGGGTVTLFIFLPGDILGCVPVLTGGPNASGAEALDAVEADVMPRSAFERVLIEEPALTSDLVALLSTRLRDACDVIESLSTPGAKRRVAGALLALVPEDHPPGEQLSVRLPVSAHEFAGALGMAPETFSRAVSDLATGGIVQRVRAGELEILDPGGLEATTREPID